MTLYYQIPMDRFRVGHVMGTVLQGNPNGLVPGQSSSIPAVGAHTSNKLRWRAGGLGFVRHQVRPEDQLRPIVFHLDPRRRPLNLFQAVNRASTY
jgi:hypothetical protein